MLCKLKSRARIDKECRLFELQGKKMEAELHRFWCNLIRSMVIQAVIEDLGMPSADAPELDI